MEELKEQIEKYQPYNEQEEKDKQIMLKYINSFDNVLTRDNEFNSSPINTSTSTNSAVFSFLNFL